jgi:hypothetical protein
MLRSIGDYVATLASGPNDYFTWDTRISEIGVLIWITSTCISIKYVLWMRSISAWL